MHIPDISFDWKLILRESYVDLSSLNHDFAREEIKQAFFSFDRNEAPGPHRYSFSFF